MQETFRALIDRDGRHGVSPDADREERLRHRARRADHPRAGRDAHGRLAEHLGAERPLPGARREEPLRGRRRAVRVQGRQEPRPGRSWRSRCAPATTSPSSGRRARSDGRPRPPPHVAAARLGADGRRVRLDGRRGVGGAGTGAGRARRPAPRPTCRSSSRRTNTRPCACWSTSSSRATSARAAPPTPACRSSWTSSCSTSHGWPRSRAARRRCAAAWRGSISSASAGSTRPWSRCSEAEQIARARRHLAPPPGAADRGPGPGTRDRQIGCERLARAAGSLARPRLLQQLPRPHGDGILDDEDGDGRPALHGQPGRRDWEGCPADALKKLGVSYGRWSPEQDAEDLSRPRSPRRPAVSSARSWRRPAGSRRGQR